MAANSGYSPAPASPGRSLSPLAAAFRVLLYPEDTFRRLPSRLPFLWPGLIQTALYLLISLVAAGPTLHITRAMVQNTPHFSPAMLPFVTTMASVALFAAPFLKWASWAVVALAYYLFGFFLCPGENRFGSWYSVAVLASFPGVLAGAAGAALLHLLPQAQLVSLFLRKINPLVFLSAAAFLPSPLRSSGLGLFLGQVTPFLIWYLALASVGYAVTGRVSLGKAAAVVAGLWLLEAAAGAGLGALGAAAGGGAVLG